MRDFATLYDSTKEKAKEEKYQDLTQEIPKLWNIQRNIIPTWDNPREIFKRIKMTLEMEHELLNCKDSDKDCA